MPTEVFFTSESAFLAHMSKTHQRVLSSVECKQYVISESTCSVSAPDLPLFLTTIEAAIAESVERNIGLIAHLDVKKPSVHPSTEKTANFVPSYTPSVNQYLSYGGKMSPDHEVDVDEIAEMLNKAEEADRASQKDASVDNLGEIIVIDSTDEESTQGIYTYGTRLIVHSNVNLFYS